MTAFFKGLPPDPGSNDDWFIRFRAGDDREFKVVFDLYYRGLVKYAIRVLHSEEDADDIAFDCVTKAWKRRGKYDSPTNLRNWLYQAVRNACVSRLRRRQTEIRAETELHRLQSTVEAEGAWEVEKTFVAVLVRVFEEMQRIPPRERDAICYHFFGGLSDAEISKLLETNPENVALLRFRGLRKLKSRLKGDWPLALLFLFAKGLS
jgi:RNA polymerase sigma factor (sigma-70 family)